MSKVLILYATQEGQTGRIARRMAETLSTDGHAVTLVDADHEAAPDELERFDAIVVGGPIHAGGYPRSVVRFARDHRRTLERARSAFFSVGLAIASRTHDGRAQTLEVVERFVGKCGWRPARVELIAGALPYSKYNFLIRFIMRRITKKEGGDTDTSRDYEYTDWAAVDRFARSLLTRERAPEKEASVARA